MSPDLSKDELKKVFKEAMKEWMDDKFKDFGKWTLTAIGTAVFGGAIYFIFWIEGLKK